MTSPLVRAIESGFTGGALLLMDRGASLSAPKARAHAPLAMAVQEDRPEVYKALIERGAPLNEKSGPLGHTPLLVAVLRRRVDACRCLIEHGANVDAPSTAGTTPLWIGAPAADDLTLGGWAEGVQPRLRSQTLGAL
jgi:hypothetical protein